VAEDKFEVIDPLSRVSKEGGFVLFEDDAELIPQDLDEIPIEVPALDDKQDDRRFDDGEEPFESESFDKTHDPVRLYLREMGSVRLLNREGEIEIARRIERGLSRMRRTLSRCPLIVLEIIEIAEEVRSGAVPARDVLQCNDPLPGDARTAPRAARAVRNHAGSGR
jgi:RNA polymerase primary sigma factor